MKDTYQRLGLAFRAGRLQCGLTAVREALANNTAQLVFVAKDAGNTTRRKVITWAEQVGCSVIETGSKDLLGRALGRDVQAVVAVTEEAIAEAISKPIPRSSYLVRGKVQGGCNRCQKK